MLAIPRARLQQVLYEAAVRNGADVRFSMAVTELDEATPALTFDTGERFTADLIVRSDGKHSLCRSPKIISFSFRWSTGT